MTTKETAPDAGCPICGCPEQWEGHHGTDIHQSIIAERDELRSDLRAACNASDAMLRVKDDEIASLICANGALTEKLKQTELDCNDAQRVWSTETCEAEEEVQKFKARAEAAEAQVAALRAALRDIRDYSDHDEYAHAYSTNCPVCTATDALTNTDPSKVGP